MADRKRVALAASGSTAAHPAIDAAFSYCSEHEIEELLAIHILDTELSRYGEIDQLADGSSKADFVNYIKERALATAGSLHELLYEKAATCNIQLIWLQKEGDPLTEICDITSRKRVDLLFVGRGERSASFFSPPKNLATKLLKRCKCQVVIVADGNSVA